MFYITQHYCDKCGHWWYDVGNSELCQDTRIGKPCRHFQINGCRTRTENLTVADVDTLWQEAKANG